MVSVGLQLVGIVTAVGFSKGLWMECATYSTGITQCDFYSSLLNLPADTQAAQALMATSIAVSFLASIICVPGMRCTIFSQGSPVKDRIAVIGGVAFAVGGLLCFIPVVWNIHVILRDFYNPIVHDGMKFEIGEALYLGILSSLISLIGGLILCASCSPRDSHTTSYSPYRARTLGNRNAPPPDMTQKTELNAYNLTGYV
uniref:Claudin-2 n=1 Tax=Sphaerodactylus townsendi TaxID=933632 RepID=A0ACB8FZ22_9SAUR